MFFDRLTVRCNGQLSFGEGAESASVVTSFQHSIVEPPEPREHRNTGTQEHGIKELQEPETQEHATRDIDVSLLRN